MCELVTPREVAHVRFAWSSQRCDRLSGGMGTLESDLWASSAVEVVQEEQERMGVTLQVGPKVRAQHPGHIRKPRLAGPQALGSAPADRVPQAASLSRGQAWGP